MVFNTAYSEHAPGVNPNSSDEKWNMVSILLTDTILQLVFISPYNNRSSDKTPTVV